MIKLTNIDGRRVLVAPHEIASVTEAGTSSQWHGIKSIVRMSSGKTIEAQESLREIETALSAVQYRRHDDTGTKGGE